MKKRFALVICAALIVGALATVAAQNNVDSNVVNVLQTAFTNTTLASSLTMNVQTTTDVTNPQTSTTTNRQGSATYQMVGTATDWNISGSETTTGGAPGTVSAGTPTAAPQNTSIDLVIVDGKTYIRFTAVPDYMQQQNLPTVWTEVPAQGQVGNGASGNGGNGGARGGFFGGGVNITSAQIAAVLYLPLDAASVTAASGPTTDTIDGQSMNAYQVTFDPTALGNSQAASLVRGAFGGGFAGGRGGNGAGRGSGTPAANGGAATQQAFQPTPMNTQVTATIWVGSDGLIYQIKTVVTRTPVDANATGPGAIDTTTTITTDFTNFNQAVTITAPTVGS